MWRCLHAVGGGGRYRALPCPLADGRETPLLAPAAAGQQCLACEGRLKVMGGFLYVIGYLDKKKKKIESVRSSGQSFKYC